MDLLQDPRYQDTPVYLFFEKYILNIVGYLADDKREILEDINLQEIFNTRSSAWRDAVKEVLHLSDTIDIAILYQWHLYIEQAQNEDQEADPDAFSRNFVDAYFREDSGIDVWTEETLRNAEQYIQGNQILKKA